MKDFNNLYKSYLKSIVKEDFDNVVEDQNDALSSIDDIRKKYVGRKIVHKDLVWTKGAAPQDSEPLKFSKEDNLINGIEELNGKPGKYKIVLDHEIDIWKCQIYGNDNGFTVDELIKKFNDWERPAAFNIRKSDGRGEWYDTFTVKIDRGDWDDGWCFEESVPSDEEFKNALKDYVLEHRRKLIEQAENFGKELGF